MVQIHPFRALRPAPGAAGRVASVPYDVVSAAEARELAAGNPDSFLHVVRPEIGLPTGTDPHAAEVYERGGAALAGLLERGSLVRDDEPALYLYRQVWRGRTQVGVVACCPVDDYDDGTIRRHEKTRPDKEDDRTRHALALSAHAGPVFLTYRGRPEIDRRVAEVTDGEAAPETPAEPLYDLEAADGVRHTIWRLDGEAASDLAAAFGAVDATYVADGHHRSAAYSRVRAELRGGRPEAERFLAVLFPADQLTILPYNRLVHDLAGAGPETFLAGLREVVEVGDGAAEPSGSGRIAMYLGGRSGGRWFELRLPAERVEDPDPVASLDAAILQDLILAPRLGIDDPRTSPRIEFVGGIRGTGELERRVDAGEGAVAFSLRALGIGQLMAVADAGRVLPPKSTWFEPKLRSGLLIHPF